MLIPIVAASKKQGSHTSLIVALVGDPHQLCPVVKTRHLIAKQILEESLPQRLLEKRDDRVKSVFLRVQYRMHPVICRMVSEVFYDAKLRKWIMCL